MDDEEMSIAFQFGELADSDALGTRFALQGRALSAWRSL